MLYHRAPLQVIVPLVYRPAIKSAMLSAPFTSTLAQVIGIHSHTFLHSWGTAWVLCSLAAFAICRLSSILAAAGVLVGKLSSGEEGDEAVNVCTMAMEAVVVLFNHEACLVECSHQPVQLACGLRGRLRG